MQLPPVPDDDDDDLLEPEEPPKTAAVHRPQEACQEPPRVPTRLQNGGGKVLFGKALLSIQPGTTRAGERGGLPTSSTRTCPPRLPVAQPATVEMKAQLPVAPLAKEETHQQHQQEVQAFVKTPSPPSEEGLPVYSQAPSSSSQAPRQVNSRRTEPWDQKDQNGWKGSWEEEEGGSSWWDDERWGGGDWKRGWEEEDPWNVASERERGPPDPEPPVLNGKTRKEDPPISDLPSKDSEEGEEVFSSEGEDCDEEAVVAVRKMEKKGCAVVLLCNDQVLNFSVELRCAVIDGVCVEVQRHSRKNVETEEKGVFVGWGHRVESRCTVSEEGLKAYFNGLVGIAVPRALQPQPPFEEKSMLYPLTSSKALRLDAKAQPAADQASLEKLLEGPHNDEDLVSTLFDAKEALDDLWNKPPPPMARSVFQRVAISQLFPHSGFGEGKEHRNRAGEKLQEILDFSELLEGVPRGSAFLDLCGGPGAWSQYLLSRTDLRLHGYGFTLRSGAGEEWQAQDKDDWYPDLLRDSRWQALWGTDDSGDLLTTANLQHCITTINQQSGGAFLVVADGGFSDSSIPRHQLELYFYRLLLAEVLTAILCLQADGRFVCKMYTAFSTATAALLYITTRLFDNVSVVKPMSSRATGPERYLVATGFRKGPEMTTEQTRLHVALMRAHKFGSGQSIFQVPLLKPIFSQGELEQDEDFIASYTDMVRLHAKRQATAFLSIKQRAEELETMALAAANYAEEGFSLSQPPPATGKLFKDGYQ